jgi:hypothetical protein
MSLAFFKVTFAVCHHHFRIQLLKKRKKNNKKYEEKKNQDTFLKCVKENDQK